MRLGAPFTLPRRTRFMRGPYTERPFDAPTLQTPRLRLRPHHLDDADDWFALQSDPEVVRYLPWPIRSRAESRRHLRARTRHTRLWQADDFLALAVEHRGRLIGDASLHLRTVDPASRTVEVGWITSPAVAGNGFATEAGLACLDFAFTTLRAQLAVAVVDHRNAASLAVASKLGFVPAGSRDGERALVLTSVMHFASSGVAQRPHRTRTEPVSGWERGDSLASHPAHLESRR